MSDLREWMNLLIEFKEGSGIDRELEEFGIPTDPELYQEYSKEFIYCLVRYMSLHWDHLDAGIRNRITKVFDAEMPVLDDDLVLYRGMALGSLEQLDPETNFLNMETVQWDRFISTSFNPKVAFEFMNEFSKVKILFKIHAIKGARGIVTDSDDFHWFFYPLDNDEESVFDGIQDENEEVILGRGSRFEIVSKQHEEIESEYSKIGMEDHWIVEMQQVK